MGTFHLAKTSEISGLKLNGTVKIPGKVFENLGIRFGRVPFDQNFRKSRFKIEWNRHFLEIRFENFGSPLEVVLFSGNFLFHLAFLPGMNMPQFL